VVDVQENFEVTKFRMSDGRVLNSDEIFAFLDKWKTGYITLTEFELALKEAGVIASDKDVKALFDQFDKNHDGRITFDEFHSPVRSRYYY
jgi:Ca2+-binding EF-hand superfamily protein